MGQLKRALKMLKKAKKPLFLAGGGVNITRANEVFTEVVEKTEVPVVTTIMGRGAVPTDHPLLYRETLNGAYRFEHGSQAVRSFILDRNTF